MRSPRCAILLSAIITYSIYASPVVGDYLSSRARRIGTPSTTTFDSQPLGYTPPYGPQDSEFAADVISNSMIPLDTYKLVIKLASKLALDDFNGQMPAAVNFFRDPQFPDIFATASSQGSRPLTPRRFVL